MKRLIGTLAVAILTALLGVTEWACSTGSTVVDPEEPSPDTWTGSHIDALVRVWGIPYSLRALSNGGTIYEYYEETVPSDDGDDDVEWCVTQFETDSTGLITYVAWQGDGCP